MAPLDLTDDLLAAIDPGGRGRVGLLARDDRDGSIVGRHLADEAFESASLIKVAILARLLDRAGRDLELTDSCIVAEEDRAPGDGLLKDWALPVASSLGDLAVAMIVLSDNTATNRLLRRLGVDDLNGALERWGYRSTRSTGLVRTRAPGEPGIGRTTSAEMVRLLDETRSGRFGGAPGAAWATRVLEAQQDERALRRYLAPGTRLGHKTGTAGTLRHDAGFLSGTDGALATVAILTEGVGPAIERNDHPAVLGIGRAMALMVRRLALPVELVPWAPPD